MRAVVFGICLALCALCHVAGAEESSGAASIELTLSIDDSVYLASQPIIVSVCVRNGSRDVFDDLVPLDPADGFLRLRLIDSDTGVILQKYGTIRDVLFSNDGITIPPGEVHCEVFDLLYHFGRWPTKDQMLLKSLAMYALPPGRYELSGSISARTGHNKALLPVILRSNSVRFQVKSAGSNASQEALLTSLTSRDQWRTNKLSPANVRSARDHLREFISSPYFLLAYRAARPSLTSSDVDSLDQLLERRKNAPALWRAVLVWDDFERVARSDSERLNRLDGIEQRTRGGPVEDVTHSLKMRVQQQKYYSP